MGTRVCAGHWKEEERRQEHCCTTALLYGPTPNACRLASCTQGWLPSIPTPAHAQAPPDEGRRRHCRAACVTLLSAIPYTVCMSKCHKDDDVYDDEANAASSIHDKLERGVTLVGKKSFRAKITP